MSTLVVGDVHGCSDELARIVRLARPERVILVGDLFTKGPDPAGVWTQIRDGGFEAVLGNHDQRVLEPRDSDRAAHDCIRALDRADPDWRPWTQALPLFREAAPFTVVHAGLHPSGKLKKTTKQHAINRRRHPTEDERDPLWWQVYTGKRRVIFGHDARRGLVRVERDGAPWLIGLDTGCVYGGRLSGYLVEADRLVQIPSKRVYKPT